MINRIPNPSTALHQVEERASQIATSAMQSWKPAIKRVEDVMVERPKTCLFAALAAGAVLGWMLKRR